MNFFPNIPSNDNMFIPENNMFKIPVNINNQDIIYKINELENRIKKLEQKITMLENESNNNEFYPPDNSLYMI